MLRIGYVRLIEGDAQGDPTTILRQMDCNAVRVEEDGDAEAVLGSILDFIGEGDELVTPSLQHLGRSSRAILELIGRLEARGAILITAEPAMRSDGPEAATMKAILQSLAALEPPDLPRRRTRAPASEIRAMQRAGLGPVEIARRLGVSRMTVWRKLKAMQAEPCAC